MAAFLIPPALAMAMNRLRATTPHRRAYLILAGACTRQSRVETLLLWTLTLLAARNLDGS